MKRTIVIAAFVLILAIIWFYLDGREENHTPDKSVRRESPAATGGKSAAASDMRHPSNNAPKISFTNDDLKVIAITEEEFKPMLDAPVELYGQVLDQHDSPVKDAKVTCSLPMMTSMETAKELRTTADGRFEFKDIKSIAIKIKVYPPEGYRRLPAEEGKPRDFIQIADPPDRIKRHEYYKSLPHEIKSKMFIAEAYKPDKNKPMIFRVERLEK